MLLDRLIITVAACNVSFRLKRLTQQLCDGEGFEMCRHEGPKTFLLDFLDCFIPQYLLTTSNNVRSNTDAFVLA